MTPPPRRRRPVLAALGAVAALVVALGAMTYDRYHVYLVRSGQIPAKQEQVVQAGESVTVKHVSWKSTMETVPQIPGSKPQPGSAYVKSTSAGRPSTRTVQDGQAQGTVRDGSTGPYLGGPGRR